MADTPITVSFPGTILVSGSGGGGGGTSDHGELTGLTDDDHAQYLNNARGDARYAPLSHQHVNLDISGKLRLAVGDGQYLWLKPVVEDGKITLQPIPE